MEIRPLNPGDIDRLAEIDATIESSQFLFLDRAGDGIARTWRLESRPLRDKLIQANPLDEDMRFVLRQVAGGAEEGIALIGEHNDQIVASALAVPDFAHRTLNVIDIRVEVEFRRQGLGTVMMYRLIDDARRRELRAVAVETRTNNFPANQLLQKLAFDLAGVDTLRHSNHDFVKETATLFWYAALD
jgi:ribosomal protein S18 acetylase RimI-like enzyme